MVATQLELANILADGSSMQVKLYAEELANGFMENKNDWH